MNVVSRTLAAAAISLVSGASPLPGQVDLPVHADGAVNGFHDLSWGDRAPRSRRIL